MEEKRIKDVLDLESIRQTSIRAIRELCQSLSYAKGQGIKVDPSAHLLLATNGLDYYSEWRKKNFFACWLGILILMVFGFLLLYKSNLSALFVLKSVVLTNVVNFTIYYSIILALVVGLKMFCDWNFSKISYIRECCSTCCEDKEILISIWQLLTKNFDKVPFLNWKKAVLYWLSWTFFYMFSLFLETEGVLKKRVDYVVFFLSIGLVYFINFFGEKKEKRRENE